jgi:hypothetical protein
MKKISGIVVSLFVLTLLLSPILAKADIFITKTKHTDEVVVMGQVQPAKDEQGISWMANDRMRDDIGDISTIARLDLNKVYIINNKDKTYSEIDLPIAFDKILPAEAMQYLQMMQVTATVKDTGETQKIKDWNCKKYLAEISVLMMGMTVPMTIEMWTSKDLGIDLDIYKKFRNETLLLSPMFKNIIEEFQKIEDYPVLTKTSMTMMGAETKYQEQVLSVEKKDAPQGTYDLPQGYTKTAYNPFQR